MKKRVYTALAALFAVLMLLAALGCGGGKGSSSGAPKGSGAAQTQQQSSAKPEKKTGGRYTMSDVRQLKGTEHFSRNALEHIFDGTVNKKGKATGYHYSKIEGSKGRIIDGTRSKKDARGVFTAKVEVDGVKKEGFSTFYPEDWTPQQVVDAINTAYKDATSNPKNPRGSLWIGHAGDLEIDMYLDDHKKILTAYPIYQKNK